MSLFGFRRRVSTHVVPEGFVPGPRELWIENKGDANLRIMLEPWCDTVDVPPGQYARLNANVSDDRDEFHIEYFSDAYLGVYCPPQTTIAIVEKRC